MMALVVIIIMFCRICFEHTYTHTTTDNIVFMSFYLLIMEMVVKGDENDAEANMK
jgi:hypothetical protein